MAPLVILVEFLVKPDFVQRFARLIRANAKASVEREPGCRRFDVLLGPDDPRRFVLYEIYDDDVAFDRHLQTPHFKSFAAATKANSNNARSGGWVSFGPTRNAAGWSARRAARRRARPR